MAAQICKKNGFSNAYYPKTQLIKVLSSLDSSRPDGRVKTKIWGSRVLFLHENYFKTCSVAIFPKIHSDFGSLEKYIWAINENCFGTLLETSSKCHNDLLQIKQKRFVQKTEKLDFTIF